MNWSRIRVDPSSWHEENPRPPGVTILVVVRRRDDRRSGENPRRSDTMEGQEAEGGQCILSVFLRGGPMIT